MLQAGRICPSIFQGNPKKSLWSRRRKKKPQQRAEGTIDDPLNLQAADLPLSASGADLSTLPRMAGRPLPSVPFGISGRLRHRGAGRLDVTGVQSKPAGSTINGEVSAERLKGVPLIVAKLQ